jgi:ABC-2 type transport system ATP-binding protein
MTGFKHRLADHLSGGMKQKLALTCALIHTPQVVFLDEPTTGVDPVSRREFWTILYRLPTQGVAVVVSTPYMDEAERCMRLAFVREGRLLQCASPQDLKAGLRGEVVALRVSPLREARDLLLRHPQALQSTLFGEEIHVVVREAAADLPTIVDALTRAGCHVEEARTVSPTLEDVFVALSQAGGGSPANA